MAIANLVCRGGVGPAGSIPYFVTHGLGSYGDAPTSVIEQLPGGGIPHSGRKKKRKPEEIKERLDLKVYLEDLYTRLYEPSVELPEEIVAQVNKVVFAKPKAVSLPAPATINFAKVAAQINAVENLLKAYEIKVALEKQLEDEEEFMILMSQQ